MRTKYVFAVLLAVMLVLNLEIRVKNYTPSLTSKAAFANPKGEGDCLTCTDPESGQSGVRVTCRVGLATCVTQECVSGICQF